MKKLVDYSKNLMLKHGLIDTTHEVKNIKTHVFPTYYISGEVREEINQFDSKIELLHSTDLIYGIQYLLQEAGIC